MFKMESCGSLRLFKSTICNPCLQMKDVSAHFPSLIQKRQSGQVEFSCKQTEIKFTYSYSPKHFESILEVYNKHVE